MKTTINMAKRALLIETENDGEEKSLSELFPADYMKKSKYVKRKDFVDKFGVPTGKTYVELKGVNEEEEETKEII